MWGYAQDSMLLDIPVCSFVFLFSFFFLFAVIPHFVLPQINSDSFTFDAHLFLYIFSFWFARETNCCQALHKGARPVHWLCPAMPRLEHVKEEAPHYKRSCRRMCDLPQHRLRSLKIQRELGGKEIPLSVVVLSYKSTSCDVRHP